MEFIKGEEYNLEGRVIVFSKYIGEDNEKFSNGAIFAVYASHKIEDFIAKFDIPEEIADGMKKQFEMQKKKVDGNKQTRGFIGKQIPVANEVDLYLGEEDVVHAGNFDNPHKCIKAVEECVNEYISSFGKKKPNMEKVERREEDRLDYSKIDSAEIEEYLLANFVRPMRDSKDASLTEKSAKIFSENAPKFVAEDLNNIIRLSMARKPNLKLINLYVKKISAVKKENYDEAGKIKKRIEEISQYNLEN